MMRQISLSLAVIALLPDPAHARLTRLNIESTENVPAAKPGASGYRILRGTYQGEIDPTDPHNRLILDVSRAARLPNGKVGYTATFAIAVPADRKSASGFLWYDVPNRGFGPLKPDADGHVRVVSGWQGDIAPQKGVHWLDAPTAYGANGKPITGLVLQRITDMPDGAASVPIVGGIGRPTPRPLPISLDTKQARLFEQTSDSSPLVPIPSNDWRFADCRSSPFPGRPDPTQICLRNGYDPAQAYTVVYRAKDPKVLGTGFAAMRDLNAFLRYGDKDDAGTPNPVAGLVRWSIITGSSQAGNVVRTFISLGFNAAEDGRRVFDGANPDIAGRQVPLNIRFGVPGGAAGLFEPGSEGTLWWGRYDDRARGRGTSSLLDRCRATGTCPKIVETFGSAELWGLRMSPDLVGTDAKRDIPLPPEVRRYYFPSTSHGGSYTGGSFSRKGDPAFPGGPQCTLPWNPNPSAPTRRAVLHALTDWISRGKEPPQSRYPTLANDDLVEPTAEAIGWPGIPGAPSPNGKLNRLIDQDFGSGFDHANLSGVMTRQPPVIRQTIPSRVPRVNADGNEVSGVPSVHLLVPVGTYLGWNELAAGYGKGGGCTFIGGFIPFARTEEERRRNGDPRPSLEARYRDHTGFVGKVKAVTIEQVAQGWLLAEDAETIVKQAAESDVLR